MIQEDGSRSFLINDYGKSVSFMTTLRCTLLTLCSDLSWWSSLGYDEVTASSLIKIDLDDNIRHPGVCGDIYGIIHS